MFQSKPTLCDRDTIEDFTPSTTEANSDPSLPPKSEQRTSLKRGLGTDVLTAARARIAWVLANVPRVYVSFSGGKDSTVMFHLVAEEARRQGRQIGVLFVDLEAQYTSTIEHVREMMALYADCIDPYWVALPIVLRNAVSQFEPRWVCWDANLRDIWVREPDAAAITMIRTTRRILTRRAR